MNSMRESIFIWESVQHGSHPPGKTLPAPDASQTTFCVVRQSVSVMMLVKINQSTSKHADIRDCQIQAFRSRRGNDVSRVTQEEELSELHGLGDKTSHWGDALCRDRAIV